MNDLPCTVNDNQALQFEHDLLTPGELAAMLRIPTRTLEKWTLQKRLPVVKVGRLNRFPRVEIEKRLLSGCLLK